MVPATFSGCSAGKAQSRKTSDAAAPRPARRPAPSATSSPLSTESDPTTLTITWTTRPETAADIGAVREVNLDAFPTSAEADLVEALRTDPAAWLPGLSWTVQTPDGTVVGFALLTRCHVDHTPALALGPCAVRTEYQRQGAGSAVIRAALRAALEREENVVVVLGHAGYYPRFGFTPASGFGIHPPFEVSDESMMALVCDRTRPVPFGTIHYAAPFGI